MSNDTRLRNGFSRFVQQRDIPAYTAGKIAEWHEATKGQTFKDKAARDNGLRGALASVRIPESQIKATLDWVRHIETHGMHDDGTLGPERAPAAAPTRDMTPPPPPPRTEHQRWAHDATAALRQVSASLIEPTR